MSYKTVQHFADLAKKYRMQYDSFFCGLLQLASIGDNPDLAQEMENYITFRGVDRMLGQYKAKKLPRKTLG